MRTIAPTPDPGSAVAQQQRDDGGRHCDSENDADVKTDGRVAGGQRDDDADRAGARDEGQRHGGEGHVRLGRRVLSLLVGGALLVFQHREARVCDDQAARDLQGGQVKAEETHDE